MGVARTSRAVSAETPLRGRAEEAVGNIVRKGQARPPVSRETDHGKSEIRGT
jgi:hypothetical protein